MDEKEKQPLQRHTPRLLAIIARPFRRIGSALTSLTFWFALLVIGNLIFFLGSLWQPIGDAIDEIITFGQSSNEMINAIKAIEESSGIKMEDFVSVAFENVKSLRIDAANTVAMARRIEAALVEPLVHTWQYRIPQEDPDCLGGIESVFRGINAERILSLDGVREARFVDGAGYAHAFSAMCFGNDLAVFATGYNQAGTEEKFSDLITAVTEKWPNIEESSP